MDFLAPRRAAAIRIATHITSCKSGEQSSFLSTETLAPTGIPSSSGLLVISRAEPKGRSIGRSPGLSWRPYL